MGKFTRQEAQRIVQAVRRRRIITLWIAIPAIGGTLVMVLSQLPPGDQGGFPLMHLNLVHRCELFGLHGLALGVLGAVVAVLGFLLHLYNWRCPACGAAMRGRAAACHRCGAPFEAGQIDQASAAAGTPLVPGGAVPAGPARPAAPRRPSAPAPAKKAARPAAPPAVAAGAGAPSQTPGRAISPPAGGPPAPVLSPVQIWALAAGANLTRTRGDRLDRLELGCSVEKARESLSTWWDVNGPEDVHLTLGWLRHEGHSDELQRVLQTLAAVPESDFEAFLAAQSKSMQHRYRFAHDHRAEFKNGTLEAWDMVRMSFVARASYTAGWLDEAAAWEAVLEAARRMQRSHTSWVDLSQCYLLGRRYWAGGDPEQQKNFDKFGSWLEQSSKSPWHALDWTLPLATIHLVN